VHDKPANANNLFENTRLLFLASQSEGLFTLALFQKVMINISPIPMGVNFQRGLFVLADLSCVAWFIMGLYNSSSLLYSLRSSWVFSQPKGKSRMVQYPGYTVAAVCI
jgi:hypothetical protein